jgi:transposase-like protein
MNTENQVPRKYKRYDEAFKRSAVDLWLQGGKSVEQIASELGISSQSLKLWKKQLAALPANRVGNAIAPVL